MSVLDKLFGPRKGRVEYLPTNIEAPEPEKPISFGSLSKDEQKVYAASIWDNERNTPKGEAYPLLDKENLEKLDEIIAGFRETYPSEWVIEMAKSMAPDHYVLVKLPRGTEVKQEDLTLIRGLLRKLYGSKTKIEKLDKPVNVPLFK